MTPRQLAGHLAVIDIRLSQLQSAIRARSWEDTEWQFDRVRRAVNKLDAANIDPAERPKED